MTAEENQSPQPSAETLWREYESCQKAAQNLESVIWRTSGVIGIGSVGTLILVANRAGNEQPPWFIVTIIGLFIFLLSIIWWFMARRYWSIQHALFMRMRHIEKRLGIHATRYLQYLDDPSTLSGSGLSATEVKELKDRAEKRGPFAPHQRRGVQSVLWLLPVITLIVWGSYVGWLISQPSCPP